MMAALRPRALWLPAAIVLWIVLTATRLDYNTVYHDEAFHILLGRQLLAGDPCPGCAFATGSAWIHPIVAALGDSLGGLAGARAMNMVFALGLAFVIFRTTRLLFGGAYGATAAVVFLFSGQTLYLSKLASYDMIAAFFLGLSFMLLLEARAAPRPASRRGLLLAGAVTLFLASITKYLVPVFVPLLLLWVFRRHGPRRALAWFLMPLALLAAGYAWALYPEREALLGTMGASSVATQVPRSTLIDWTFRWIALPLLAAVFGCFHAARRRTAWRLIVLSSPIILLHLVTGAEQSVNKNVILALVFLSPAVALGIDHLAYIFSMGGFSRTAHSFYLGAVLVVFGVYGMYHMRWLERQYPDMTPVVEFFTQNGFDGMRVGINSSYGDAVYLYSLGDTFPGAEWFYVAEADQSRLRDVEEFRNADFLVFDEYYGERHPLEDYRDRLSEDFAVLGEWQIELAWGSTQASVLGRR